MPYPHSEIETKWQKYWSEYDTFACVNPELENSHKPKFYALDMFPYPSGAGLHVGHPKGYTATDIIARYKHAKGFHVLHPMGWDAFGLPAENYAIKTGTHPAITTAENIDRFRAQLKKFGFSFDWNREVDTTSPEYYKWSQWIFLKLFEAGLAYESDKPINFCPSCKTGLANEEVVDGKCERCGTTVVKKAIRQWILAITKYADRLISDIDRLDWPEGIKEQQRNWIGKSEGCQFFFRGVDCPDVEVFTTRIDTVFSGAFIVIAPDHPRVNEYIHADQRQVCEEYINRTKEETDIERTNVQKEKTGVFTGSYATNPYDGSKLPIWIGDFVLGHYGTGAVFGDAHDERDFVFAKKYGIPLKQSIAPYITMSGINSPKTDALQHKRKTVNAIVEFEGKFLILKEPQNYRLLGGGVESGEETIDTIKREITEETGFYDFSEIESVFGSHIFANGFHLKKQHNVEADDTPVFYVRLNSLRQQEFDSAELAWHSIHWVEKAEMAKLLSFEQHQYQWSQFTNPRAFVDDGILINSGEFDGLTSVEARKVLTEKAEKDGFGKKVTNYKLRDWIFSRQRYWGEPIPLIHINLDASEPHPLPFSSQEKGVETNTGWPIAQKDWENYEATFPGTIIRAKKLRKNGTKTEEILWEFLRDRQFLGLKFRRQHPISQYIADFYCAELNVVIELDGDIHETQEQKEYDQERNIFMKKMDINILRYKNESLNDIESFLKNLKKDIETISNSPLMLGEGLGVRFSDNSKNEKEAGGEVSLITLNFRSADTWKRIQSGEKTIETRALNPEEPERYFENIRFGDCVVFNLVETGEKMLVKIKQVSLWKSLQFLHESMKEYPEEKFGKRIFCEERIFSNEELIAKYDTLAPGYAEKIEKNGLIGFEFEMMGKLTRGISGWLLADWDLPLKLPEVEKYEPSGDGESPLATIPDWVNVRLGNNLVGKRETNTMPQWAGSCWYYLRFMDPTNSEAIVDPAVVKYWGEIDSYIGGAEHAVLHLLYARFWHKFLFDIGVVPTDEPFFRLRNVGLILGPDGEKMSKSKGNVVNPDDVISEYGADTLRLYEMGMADFADVSPWNTKAIVGSYRLLDKIYKLFTTDTTTTEYQSWTAKEDLKAIKIMHKTIKKVGEDIENMKFNTAIAAINIMVNEGIPTDPQNAHEWKSVLARILSPFAPHMAEECWSFLEGRMKNEEGIIEDTEQSIYFASWPEYISALTIDDEVQIAIQINGKLRGTYSFMRGVTAEEVRLTIEEKPEIAKWLEGVTVVKEIFIPNKILNIVIKS